MQMSAPGHQQPSCWIDSHHNHVIMSAMASQITSITTVYSSVYWGADQRKHPSSAFLVFVRGIHRWPVNSQHKGPVTWKKFPFGDVIMCVHQYITQHLYRTICNGAAESNLCSSWMVTHWGRDKMVAIFQTTFSNAFCLKKINKFRLRFHWSLFRRVQLAIFQQWFR